MISTQNGDFILEKVLLKRRNLVYKGNRLIIKKDMKTRAFSFFKNTIQKRDYAVFVGHFKTPKKETQSNFEKDCNNYKNPDKMHPGLLTDLLNKDKLTGFAKKTHCPKSFSINPKIYF